jgi:hypothetical protein
MYNGQSQFSYARYGMTSFTGDFNRYNGIKKQLFIIIRKLFVTYS